MPRPTCPMRLNGQMFEKIALLARTMNSREIAQSLGVRDVRVVRNFLSRHGLKAKPYDKAHLRKPRGKYAKDKPVAIPRLTPPMDFSGDNLTVRD